MRAADMDSDSLRLGYGGYLPDIARADARRDIAIATMLARAMATRPPLPAGQGLPPS